MIPLLCRQIKVGVLIVRGRILVVLLLFWFFLLCLFIVDFRKLFGAFDLVLQLIIPGCDVFLHRLGAPNLLLLDGRLLPLHLRALKQRSS